MAEPVIEACAADTWVKVATNVTSGVVHRVSVSPNVYLQTYRNTGNPAPTDNTDAVTAFPNGESLVISSAVAIDLYIKAVKKAGSVRVDL